MNAALVTGGGGGDNPLQVLWQDGERAFCRTVREGADGNRKAVLVVLPSTDPPMPGSVNRLAHEYALKDDLEDAWALRPVEFVREHGRTLLMLADPGGELLSRLIGLPLELGVFLQLAVALSTCLDRLHARGLIHKDLKPNNVLVNAATGQVRLTGFGIASRLPRENQSPEPPEFIAGTLPYMAPEQTGRMNRSIDSRSDLYSLGITLYELLTGSLPFTASDPMEWVHCHIARQPAPPHGRSENIPAAVSAIIMKLLAKTPEERYQSAVGAESDFRRCLTEWQTQNRIDEFPVGVHDTRDRLLIPEKLYGRAAEIDTLLAAFHRVVAGGRPELVLVSGYSGIGKSSVVNELHKALVPFRGVLASGKFDQYKRDIPFATLAQAFQSLVRPLLNKSEAELRQWRDALREALDPNGQLIVDMVSELRHIIGDQLPVPALPPEDAQGRFQLVCRRFIGIFARPEHPLALFLDDLQWLDNATLELLADLLTRPDMQNLLLIGAYRNNEVDAAHPLMRKLGVMRQAGAILHDIVLAPLVREDLVKLLADAFRCEPEYAVPLASLIHEKTAGNPFFAIQFLSALFEENLLAFDHAGARWRWDLSRIHAKGYTDNVVDLMVGKLNRLPIETQGALQRLACMGNSALSSLLRLVYPDLEGMHGQLWEAARAGVIFRSEDSYKFLHDRVQEAAYSLIPKESRAELHVRIGRLLAAHTPADQRGEAIFEIVNQFNRGPHLVTSVEERERVAELNLLAGRRARASTAYVSSIHYLNAGRLFLTEACWDRNYELIFAIEYLLAECEVLTADLVGAEKRLSALAQRARSGHDIAIVTRLRLTLYTSLSQLDRGVDVCLEYLRRGGTEWSLHPTKEAAKLEYDRIWSLVGRRSIEELVDLPLMADPDLIDLLDVLTEIVTPALFCDENLCSRVICRMVNLSLEHGNSDAACFAYVWFAIIAGPRFGNYTDGFRFGRLGYELVESRGLTRYQARTYMSFGNIVLPWAKHVVTGRPLIRRSFDTAYRVGDLTFAAYSCAQLITNFLAVGDPLSEVQLEAENGLAFARRARFGIVINFIEAQRALIRTLRGQTPEFGCFDSDDFDETKFERDLASNRTLMVCEFWYYVRKLQARFFSGDYGAAVDACSKAQQLLWITPSFETAEFRFYGALSHASAWDVAPPDARASHLEALTTHHRQLEIWAKHSPETFENRAALVGAEIARIQDRPLDAEQLYEQAIRSARANGFVHNEAVANELAGRFYAVRGFDKIAQMYLRDARSSYLRWGADGKVRQLDRLHIRPEEPGPVKTILAPVEHLDLATVIKVSQAVSGEIVLEKLIDTLMRIAVENAGAERGLLILARGDAYRIEAEATTSDETVRVGLRQANVSASDLPESILHYVVRTKESVLLSDAAQANPFSADEYIKRHHARSILCSPLMKQARLIGVLYLENNLAPHVFTPGRMAILKLLASEAAISLENTRLYSDLQEREARVRRLVDSNIIGIFMWKDDGQILDANEAFLRTVEYDGNDLVAGRLNWRELTPPEWGDGSEARLALLNTIGTANPYEKEYLRKSGSRVSVLVGAAKFEEGGSEGVAFVLDLTDRREAEAAAQESERRYQEIQRELAHANRVATMGQISSSIAHEINQPIAATLINAQVALRWVNETPTDTENIRSALTRIVRDANRAGDIIGRIRALINKTPPRKEDLDINLAILDVVGLTQSEAKKHDVFVDADLAEGLPLIRGDRVQLQQVILNLIINAIESMSACTDRSRDLEITTATADLDGVLVAVRDSGPGVDPADLSRIFDAFFTTKSSGLGMGLSICRGIIEAHGGQLWATTDAHGAVFQFTLPAGADGALEFEAGETGKKA